MGVLWKLGSLVFPLLLAFPAPENSGVIGPEYERIIQNNTLLANKNPTWLEKIEYGKSVEERPLVLFRLASKEIPQTSTILITGGVHGNEFLGIENLLLEKLFLVSQTDETFKKYFSRGGSFLIAPVLNPDGYANRSRFNSHFTDLNRDWKNLSQPESIALASFLEKMESPLTVSFDMHCCGNSLLMPRRDPLSSCALSFLSKKFFDFEIGTTAEKMGYTPSGTLKDYLFEKYKTRSFTFEGQYGGEMSRLDEHLAWWKEMVSETLSLRSPKG